MVTGSISLGLANLFLRFGHFDGPLVKSHFF
jgi:hypothetical protein